MRSSILAASAGPMGALTGVVARGVTGADDAGLGPEELVWLLPDDECCWK